MLAVHGERGVVGRRLISHRVLRRASWGVADQGLSSLTNFALGIFVARSATTAGFGAFSIVFTTFTVTLGLSRALTSEPLVVRCSDRSELEWRQGTVAATGTALAVGIALGLGCGLVGWTVGGTLAAPFLALGATLPGLLLQDCWRYAFFANGEGRKAFLNDALCGAVLVVLFGVLLRSGVASIGLLVLAWGGAATVGALAGARQSGVVPVPQQARAWATRHRDLIPRYLGEFVASSGAGQLSVYGVGLIGGLATLGSFRAGYLLFGPLQVLFMGIGLVAVPELVRFLRRSPRHLYLASSGLSVLLATVALAWGMVVIPMPASVGRAILGSTWSTAHALALALTVGWSASGIIAGTAAAIRALAAARQGLKARVAGSLFAIAGALLGVVLGGARGAAWGLSIAVCLECIVWRAQLTRALGEVGDPVGAERCDAATFVVGPTFVEKCGDAAS